MGNEGGGVCKVYTEFSGLTDQFARHQKCISITYQRKVVVEFIAVNVVYVHMRLNGSVPLELNKAMFVSKTSVIEKHPHIFALAAALLHAAAASRRPRPRLFMLSGLALYAIACLGFSQAGRLSDWHLLLLPALICGIAIPCFIGPVAFGTFVELPPKVFSHGYQVKNIVRQLGISSSIALSTVALQFFYARRLAALEKLDEIGRPVNTWNLGTGKPASVLQVLAAFAVEIGRVRALVREALPGEIRLRW